MDQKLKLNYKLKWNKIQKLKKWKMSERQQEIKRIIEVEVEAEAKGGLGFNESWTLWKMKLSMVAFYPTSGSQRPLQIKAGNKQTVRCRKILCWCL